MEELLRSEINRKKELISFWVERGSGWVLDGVNKVYLNITRNNPLRGEHISLFQKKLKDKKAIINMKNRDNQCLRWALKAERFPANHHSDRPSQYPTDAEDGFDFTGISFPTPLNEIHKVEKLNNITINVLGWKNGKVTPLHVSDMEGVV